MFINGKCLSLHKRKEGMNKNKQALKHRRNVNRYAGTNKAPKNRDIFDLSDTQHGYAFAKPKFKRKGK